MNNKILRLARIALIGALMLNTVSSVSAKGDTGYQTGSSAGAPQTKDFLAGHLVV